MNIKVSSRKSGVIGICGHVGVGHVHSHSGFVQDDSAGMSVVARILKEALPVNTIIRSLKVDLKSSTISIETEDGGVGQAWVRRGITPFEVDIMKNIIGKDAVFSQGIVLSCFGRIYGQGSMEVPVSLQTAVVLSLIDTFKKKWPNHVIVVDENIPINIGKILGAVIDIDKVPISLMLTVNASRGGIGPVEDLEGNVMLGNKAQIIKRLKLDKIPTFVVESKIFTPGISDFLKVNTFLFRANNEADNVTSAYCLVEAAEELKIEYKYQNNVFRRGTNDFINNTKELGRKIIEFGKSFEKADTAREKVEIIGELAILVSQDAGGVTFMSNSLQKIVGSAGMMPGITSVISLLVTKSYIEHYKIPTVTEEDITNYISIIYLAIKKLYKKLDKAENELTKKFNFNPENYKYLFDEGE
ncbi:MAG: hypothetical protein VR72_08350 [Clostridiaceae bacterium BRH_c20a]|nr:MAG: hypothetical protein VR72_08350 [Clostridiaceae bacterium BRH_c20a]